MTLHIKEHALNGITVLELDGHLVMGEEAQQLKQRVEDLVKEGHTNAILRMEGVVFIDSFGVGELVSSLTTLRKHGGALKLVNPTEFVREVLQVTHLDKVFPIFDSETEAQHSFGDGEDNTGSGAAP